MNIRIWLCALLVILWTVEGGLGAGERLTMKVSPTTSFAPATLRVHVGVEPSADNRALELVADSSDFYRSSLVQLDGDRAPRIVTLVFKSLPGGEYEIRGTLLDGAGRERAWVRQQATVISSGPER